MKRSANQSDAPSRENEEAIARIALDANREFCRMASREIHLEDVIKRACKKAYQLAAGQQPVQKSQEREEVREAVNRLENELAITEEDPAKSGLAQDIAIVCKWFRAASPPTR